MALRAQVSLLFKDKDLYENFVLPSKTQRTLNDIIIKCLSAYYYNEEVRNKVEGISLEDIVDNDTVVTDSQQICNNIREALAMQSFMMSELENTISNGMEDISNIMNQVDNMGENTGFVKNTQTEYGAGIPLLDLSPQTKPNEEKHIDFNQNQSDNGFLGFVIEKMMKNMFGESGVEVLRKEYENSIHTSDSVKVEEPIQVPEFVTTEEPLVSQVVEDKIIKEEITNSELVGGQKEAIEEVEEDVKEIEQEDATDALMSLLGSL